jgi:hypothetical protein
MATAGEVVQWFWMCNLVTSFRKAPRAKHGPILPSPEDRILNKSLAVRLGMNNLILNYQDTEAFLLELEIVANWRSK